MAKPVFKRHPKYPFLISDRGDIYSLETHKLLKQSRNNWGYHTVSGGKLVHKLVYETFHGRVIKGMDIDHIDRNLSHNWASNLRLVTKSINDRNRRTSLPGPYKHAYVP